MWESLKVWTVKCDKGYLKLNTPTDYNENSYFVGFSERPETYFSSEYRANLEAKLCGLTTWSLESKM